MEAYGLCVAAKLDELCNGCASGVPSGRAPAWPGKPRIAATPSHGQQDPEQRLQRPPRSCLRRSPRLMDLLPELGCEKLGQRLLERTDLLGHEPFLRNGVCDNTHFVGKRLFQLRQLGRTLGPAFSAAEAENHRKSLIAKTLTRDSPSTCYRRCMAPVR